MSPVNGGAIPAWPKKFIAGGVVILETSCPLSSIRIEYVIPIVEFRYIVYSGIFLKVDLFFKLNADFQKIETIYPSLFSVEYVDINKCFRCTLW